MWSRTPRFDFLARTAVPAEWIFHFMARGYARSEFESGLGYTNAT
jgi:hypothetical protein